jgi:hypothetical protein
LPRFRPTLKLLCIAPFLLHAEAPKFFQNPILYDTRGYGTVSDAVSNNHVSTPDLISSTNRALQASSSFDL